MTDMIKTDGRSLRKNTQAQMTEMAGQLRLMADILRETNERMAEMERVIRTLEKVTPRQAADLNRIVRDRAREICADYRIGGDGPRAAAAEIRKAIREMTGTRTMREIARCDYDAVRYSAETWDDYETMQRIRRKEAGKNG